MSFTQWYVWYGSWKILVTTIWYGKFLFSGKKCYDDPFYDHYEENGDDVYNYIDNAENANDDNDDNYNADDDNVDHNIIDLQQFYYWL